MGHQCSVLIFCFLTTLIRMTTRLPGARLKVVTFWGEVESMDLASTDNKQLGVLILEQPSDATHNISQGVPRSLFRLHAAEQELRQYLLGVGQPFQDKSDPDEEQARLSSLAFFVLPPNPVERDHSLIEMLRRNKTAFIYGEQGVGKTTLRLALEAECRRVTDGTLVVTVVLPAGSGHNSAADINWSHLTRNLAIDAFIQALERFNPHEVPPTPPQIKALGQLLLLGEEKLYRVVRKIVSARPDESTQWGAGDFWCGVGRFPMRYVHISKALQALVEQALQSAKTVTAVTGKQAWDEGVLAARVWGFKRFLLLVDGVDNVGLAVPEMLNLLLPFLQQTARWRKQDVIARYFLPTSLRPHVRKIIDSLPEVTAAEWFAIELEWTDAALQQLIKARFRAAGSRRVGFADLGDSTLEKSLGKPLDQLLVETANGSPRRLLQLISRMIDRLATACQERVTPDLWDSILQQLKRETNNAFSTNGVSVRPYPRRKIS